ncbi:Sporulation related domain protein [Aquimixticola soesokkakensis]|uniref:Sporulation related domain protein n=1 Tax=Aquimixticola soesokkakensis TaxID=1519096 RepID=A0A1Y5TQL7_9RHOB|nr:SPOR domain-containing protein [Aquimixticola soesokkakensis]SLN67462.1 Sporulation related domain protein [Aquimixticola soesokkakensis]
MQAVELARKQGWKSVFAAVTIAVCASFGAPAPALAAGKLSSGGEPAEFPPSSYKGTQYVDSRGCAFVRAGYGTTVNWVPRVSRDRSLLCNFVPTFDAPVAETLPVIADAPATAAPVPVVAAPAPVQTAKIAPIAVTPFAPAVAPAAVPAPIAVTAPPRDVALSPRVVPAPVTTPAPVRTPQVSVPTRLAAPAASASCSGLSAESAQYMTSRLAVRCGPQAVHPSDYGRQTMPAGRTLQTANRGVVTTSQQPTVVAVPQGTTVATVANGASAYRAPAVQKPKIPAGYRPTFDDDRLNPARGPRTAAGDAQMALRWTNDVPHQLIDRATGQVVGNLYPGLTFPYTSYEEQTLASVTVSSKSVAPVRVTAPRAAIAATPALGAGHRFVQVGTFGVPQNASATVARLQAMGLPVSTASSTGKGRALKVVLAGPFADPVAVQSALARARAAGFSDAFTRR